MSNIVRIQKIRWCHGCHELLPLKCKKCLHHPQRVPVVQEVFSWPPLLDTRNCGCIKIACQRPGCTNTMWRHPKRRGLNGNCPYKRQFCSAQCSFKAAADGRRTSKEVPCANCGKKLVRKLSELKTFSFAACSPKCRNIYMTKLKHKGATIVFEEQTSPTRSEEDLRTQFLECRAPKHRGEITEHQSIPNTKLFECTEILLGRKCGHRRTAHYNVEKGLVAA